ncbi:MAG: type II toxin-antitoxin system HicB family antitoxin [Candidatus Aenigmarchaeota archaeon]|nr:type II toxin-antitoxin system HicB family antitoxin [Candidatus Aenigmarchaeota archaeon]
MSKEFNVIIEKGEDGYLISEVMELPGCHTQAKTLDMLMKRTREAISLYLKSKKGLEITKFIGVKKIKV